MTQQPCILGLFDVPMSPVPQPAHPVAAELARLNAAAERVLARMQDGQWHSNAELCHPDCGGNRAVGARMVELRARGFRFEKRHVTRGRWEYRMMRP